MNQTGCECYAEKPIDSSQRTNAKFESELGYAWEYQPDGFSSVQSPYISCTCSVPSHPTIACCSLCMLQAQGYSVSTYLFGCKTFWRRFCDFYVPNDAEFVNQSALCSLWCGWWLVLIYCEKKILLADWWMLAGASLVWEKNTIDWMQRIECM